jgi:hypothetical protein
MFDKQKTKILLFFFFFFFKKKKVTKLFDNDTKNKLYKLTYAQN